MIVIKYGFSEDTAETEDHGGVCYLVTKPNAYGRRLVVIASA